MGQIESDEHVELVYRLSGGLGKINIPGLILEIDLG
jgi:hypothetical protein